MKCHGYKNQQRQIETQIRDFRFDHIPDVTAIKVALYTVKRYYNRCVDPVDTGEATSLSWVLVVDMVIANSEIFRPK
jgi:hypothetical protein